MMSLKTGILVMRKKDSHVRGIWLSKSPDFLGFPGGAVVKNPPTNARDMGSSPGPRRSHMLQSNWAHVPQLLGLCSRACESQLLSPCDTTIEAHAPRARASQQEKPPQWEARTPQRRVAPARCNYRKPARSNEDPMQPKMNK